jgi:predicted DNA-binding transcriptional regulator YafY
MRLEENRDGIYLVGGYNQKELDYMAHYLLSYGKDMHVESPSQLRDAYRNLLKEILSPYENHAEQ